MRGHNRETESPLDQKGATFGAFRLTLDPLCLWRGRKMIPLQPRPLAVLHYFVEHPETVVSNDTLRQAVWGRTIVSPTTVQACVREIRKVLGDDSSNPHYIETVGREGYQFIAVVAADAAPVSSSTFEVPSSNTQHSALRLGGARYRICSPSQFVGKSFGRRATARLYHRRSRHW